MLDAKRALLLGISHELRTPLSRLRLAIEFLDNEDDRESIKAEIIEMEKIVVTLLEAERLNDRHASLNRSPTNIADLVNDLLSDFFSRERQRIEVVNHAQSLVADVGEARVTLLLKNLLSNALRYAPEDAGPVELMIARSKNDLVLRVSDHGPGIAPEQMASIGQPFYRGDPSRARQTGSTGLGLYLATLVAKAHKGSLKLRETSEPGASFEVRLPLQ